MSAPSPNLAEVVQTFLEEGPFPAAFTSRLTALKHYPQGTLQPSGTDIEPPPEELRAAAGFILHYIWAALDDHHLSPEELQRIRQLKRYFQLEEGDLVRFQRQGVIHLLLTEMALILRDRTVDSAEEVHQVDLQAALDLGYDQFLELIEGQLRPVVEELLNELRSAEYPSKQLRDSVFRRLQALGTVITLDPEALTVEWSGSSSASDSGSEEEPGRTIPQAVRDAVWRRDQGRCATCGGQDRLEFDHIIPFSKGGSSTYRNVQLLCQDCNRSKSARIG